MFSAAAPGLVWPQRPPRTWKVAWLALAGIVDRDQRSWEVTTFRRSLSDRGFVEGRNFELRLFVMRAGPEGVAGTAAEATAWGPDVIVVQTSPATRAAAKATTTIPIVFGRVNDPLETGLLSDAVRPGGNVTGVAVHQKILTMKRLELIRELLPEARRVGLILDRSMGVFTQKSIDEMHARGKALGLTVEEIDPSVLPENFTGAFDKAAAMRVDAVVIAAAGNLYRPDPRGRTNDEVATDFQRNTGIPYIALRPRQTELGAVIGLGPSYSQEIDLMAGQVARILRGEKPGQMPVEWVHEIELVVNLGSARRIGVTVPKSILLRADKVIE